MGKVFTITEGLENMGAIRTGGQGSVYKGRRQGVIISAVKLLPTPIHTEDKQDKNYRDFYNEVEKLKKVNEVPNPNVVKILSSGLTESGSFPFIEMEYIEGPDLEELLQAPNDPVFSIEELIKVANQLSNALAHCHRVGIKHGDIKSNNVKFNAHTGNYVLLDFGLAIMSDEQRRTSLRHAGAVEFMAPEQNEGQMLFQSDVYSFGVILYELLAGTVPFPLNDKGETARNKVMLSHMEDTPPDVLEIRRKNLPQSWSAERRESQMRVPAWLLDIIAKCLQKNPSLRFKNGLEIQEAMVHNYTAETGDTEHLAKRYNELEKSNRDLKEKLFILQSLNRSQDIKTTKNTVHSGRISLSKPVYYAILLCLVGLIAFQVYSYYNKNPDIQDLEVANSTDYSEMDSTVVTDEPKQKAQDDFDNQIRAIIDSVQRADSTTETAGTSEEEPSYEAPRTSQTPDPVPPSTQSENRSAPKPAKYTLEAARAYFYDDANESSRRTSFLVKRNSPELTAIEEKNGFIYVEFFTINGEITRGWLRTRDLRKIGG
ncbi:MAG: serine/threonine-protein kinase [Daejeonella sp.]|uniref:serine/threonine protein kinase n=1 Tax=Daejeonella sp. TaxID=2805397 RepID=UPI003C732FCA